MPRFELLTVGMGLPPCYLPRGKLYRRRCGVNAGRWSAARIEWLIWALWVYRYD